MYNSVFKVKMVAFSIVMKLHKLSQSILEKETLYPLVAFPSGSAVKEYTYSVGDLGSIPGLERSPGEGKGYPFQYSGLENSGLGWQRVGQDWVTFTSLSWLEPRWSVFKVLAWLSDILLEGLGVSPLISWLAAAVFKPTLSSILAWWITMDRRAWWATVHGVQELNTT